MKQSFIKILFLIALALITGCTEEEVKTEPVIQEETVSQLDIYINEEVTKIAKELHDENKIYPRYKYTKTKNEKLDSGWQIYFTVEIWQELKDHNDIRKKARISGNIINHDLTDKTNDQIELIIVNELKQQKYKKLLMEAIKQSRPSVMM